MNSMEQEVHEAARKARGAAQQLAQAPRGVKDAALGAMADALSNHSENILAANQRDIERARAEGTPEHMIDRLTLDAERVDDLADGMQEVADLADPVGQIVEGSVLANGMQLREVRVPMGVIGMIYEGRPNVTADAGALCLKSGNAVLLRGSSSAAESNAAIVTALRDGLSTAGVCEDAIQLISAADRATSRALMRARGLVDLVIPRGGAGLIQTVVEESTVPVIETGTGNCHVFVDDEADLEMALQIVLNSKTHRPSVCNAAESLLVHRSVAAQFVPKVTAALVEAGVTVHGDENFVAANADVVEATDDDYATEYLSLDIAAKVVDSFDDAVAHIRRYSSGHTEAIVTESLSAAQRFTAEIDAAAVMVNASTRFTDGGEFGFGAEMGISTQKLHARGPMGLKQMTTTKFIVTGQGHIR